MLGRALLREDADNCPQAGGAAIVATVLAARGRHNSFSPPS
jgi:hypothetical protein